VGVLPKQIKPTDVSKVLYQLHLVPDRRSPEQSSFTPVNVRIEGVAAEPGVGAPARWLTESALREQFAELRRALVAGLDTQTDRITGEVRALQLEALPPPEPAARPRATPWSWIVACLALSIALLSTALWWRSVKLLDTLTVEVSRLRERQPAQPAAAVAANVQSPRPAGAPQSSTLTPGMAPSEIKPIIVAVPYGADALGGARLEVIGKLLERLVRQKVAGVADIRTFAGRFCLVGNALDGYSLAPDETPFSKCDVVGNPSDEAVSPAQHTPLALANLIANVRTATHGALDVQVSAGDAANVVSAYPPLSSELTAGDWNRVASANNRVEIRVR
jgi:hypothetical protein